MISMNVERNKVAVVGLGIAGIAAVKNLTEVGFDVTGFDTADAIGGLWHYSEEQRTTCLYNTKALVRRSTFGFSDFPYAAGDNEVPLRPAEVQAFLESYAHHFNIKSRFQLNTRVTAVHRVGNKWYLILKHKEGNQEEQAFDRLVVCTGLFQTPREPHVEGLDQFEGKVFNTQTYKKPENVEGKRVLIVGLGATATDIARSLVGIAKEIYISHRHGCLVLPYGKANDICFPSLRKQHENANVPTLEQRKMLHKALIKIQDESFDIKPEWGLGNAPSLPHKLPILGDGFYDLLVSGIVTLVPGLKRIHQSHVELTDGKNLEVDVIIFAIGYDRSYSLLGPYDPSRNMPQAWKDAPGSMGRPLPRLYQGIFFLDFPDSLAYSEHVGSTLSATINGDTASMALAQVWLGNSKLPSDEEMAISADKQNKMATDLANKGGVCDPALVDSLEWSLWADKVAGFGIQERLGYGWKAWWLRFTDPSLYKTLLDGKFLPQVYRLFDEGKRPPWKDARESLVKANELG
ncbi:dimethylaniline monooxygenase (N-oxide forming) [Trichoderma asperellum]|nr:flavin monooxygenase-like protein [Trichoderma asperelloides]